MAAPDFLRRGIWVGATVLAAVLWLTDAAGRREILEAANTYGRTPRPMGDGSSVSGWAHGQRTQLHLSADSYHWTMQTQEMIARGDWRVRWVDYDNAPMGREVHWSSPLRWWVAALAWVESAATGRPWAQAVESAAGYAGPALLLILLLGLAPVVARAIGPGPAAVFALGLVCVAPISSAFAVGSIDHHGLAVVCATGTVLGLAAAFHGAASAARRGFIASGIAGGLGLWISAATQVPVLVAVGLGAMAGAVLTRKEAIGWDASHWRAWGVAGAATSLGAYLLEYFPSGMGWRLEVNHPLHALAWAGAGEVLFRVQRGVRGGEFLGKGIERWMLAAAAAALVVLPMVVWLTGAQAFKVADPLLWALHADYIEEFGPLAEEFRRDGPLPSWAVLLLVVNVLPLLVLPAAWRALRRGEAASTRLMLWILVVPAAFGLAMALQQKRWLHLSGALGLALLVGVAAILSAKAPSGPRRWAWVGFLLLVLLPFPVAVVRQVSLLARSGAEVGPAEMRELAVRDVARWLRRRAGGESVAVLSDPTSTTALMYFGGLRGIGTLYWENLAGLRAAMEAAGAASSAEAERIFRERGITHVVLFSWQPFAEEAGRLLRGLRAWEPAPEDAFLTVVQSGTLPVWLRPLPYRLPTHPYFAERYAAVFEYAPGQTPAEAVVHQARYLWANQDEPAARRLLGAVLEAEPDFLPALCTLAEIQLRRRDAAGLDLTWPRITRQIERGVRIAPEDRAVIVLGLSAAGRREAVRAQLEIFWAEADEHALRRMPGGTLASLRRMSSEAAVTAPVAQRHLLDEILGERGP